MLATVVPRIAMVLGQHAAQAIAAGLLSGAVIGGAGVASGLIPVGAEEAQAVALLACPGSGPELGRASSGQTLLVTARSVDGQWLEVYVGEPGVTRGWVPASGLRLQAASDGLPIHGCGLTTAAQPSAIVPSGQTVAPPPTIAATAVLTPGPTLAPGASPRPTGTSRPTPSPSRTPTPTKTATPVVTPSPTPHVTPTPTPLVTTPPNNPPSISSLSGSANCVDNGSTYTQSVVSVTATDPDAGDTLTVRLRIGSIDQYGNQFYRLGSLTMTHVSGSLYQLALTQSLFQSYGWSSWTADREVTYDVTVRDSFGVDSATLHSHDNDATHLFYNPNYGCIIL